jgi:integrase
LICLSPLSNQRRIRFHDLQHTHATLLLRKNVDIKIVSQKLRHKKSSFTADVYQHVQKDMQLETADAMDAMLGEKKKSQKQSCGIGIRK